MPPSAAWNLPCLFATAPVNAPFTWPNSSLSSRFSGIAPQLIVTNGLPARGERRWISRAISSLPVPVSPVISTEMSVGAIFSTLRKTSCIGGDVPTISPKRTARAARAALVVDAELVEQQRVLRRSATPARRRRSAPHRVGPRTGRRRVVADVDDAEQPPRSSSGTHITEDSLRCITDFDRAELVVVQRVGDDQRLPRS